MPYDIVLGRIIELLQIITGPNFPAEKVPISNICLCVNSARNSHHYILAPIVITDYQSKGSLHRVA